MAITIEYFSVDPCNGKVDQDLLRRTDFETKYIIDDIYLFLNNIGHIYGNTLSQECVL